MPETILVTTDGSPESERALDVAIPLARALHLPITLLWVWEGLQGLDSVLPEDMVAEITEREVQDRLRLTRELADRRCGPAAVPTAVRSAVGPVADAIARIAHEQSARYVIMATHGRSGFKRWRLGSVADQVAREGTAPTILLSPQQAAGAEGPIGRILAPLDGSRRGEHALEEAAALARALKASVRLVRAINVFIPLAPIATGEAFEQANEQAEAQAQAYLQAVAARYPDLPVDRLVRVGSASQVILEEAAGADMVVMSTHGRGGLTRVALGSVADAVVRGCGKPVLLVRGPARAEEKAGRSA